MKKMSGQLVKFDKTLIYFSSNVKERMKEQMHNYWGFAYLTTQKNI